MTRRPLPTLTALLFASLLATSAFTASAQTTPPPPPPGAAAGPHERMAHHDPAKLQQRVAQHLAALKTKLAITPAQEGAWSAFAATMTPPANPPARPDRAAFEKMTTPERIDRMMALRAERNARMDQRTAATKTLYAALNPEQKKLFDQHSLPHHGHPMGMGGMDHDGRHGDGPRSR